MNSSETHAPTDPPRRRRRARWIALAVVLAIGAFVGWVAWQTAEAGRAKANPTVDYRARFIEWVNARRDEPLSTERWDEFAAAVQAAADAIAAVDEAWRDADETPQEPAPSHRLAALPAGEIPTEMAWERRALEAVEASGAIADLRALQDGPLPARPASPGGFLNATMHELSHVREFAVARAAAMRLAAARGDGDEVVHALRDVLLTAQVVSHHPGLIGYLVGLSVDMLAWEALRHAMADAEFDAETCREILALLERRSLPSVVVALESERHGFLDTIQRIFSDDGHGDGHILPGQLLALSAPTTPGATPPPSNAGTAENFISRFVLAGRRDTTRTANDLFDEMLKMVAMLPADRDYDALGAQIEGLSRRQLILRLLMPALASSLRTATAGEAVAEGTRLMVALELHHAIHGSYPETLDALVPEILPETPTDPIHGGPWGYRLLENDPHGRPYLLYSFGYDATDDDGAIPAASMGRPTDAIHDPDLSGVDAVINAPPTTPPG